MMVTTDFDPMLTKTKVTELLGISRATLDNWRNEGKFPQPVFIGPKCPRWAQSKVKSWIESKTHAQDS